MQWTHPPNINFTASLALILLHIFGILICILFGRVFYIFSDSVSLFSFISFCFMVFRLRLLSHLHPWSRTRSVPSSLWSVMQLEILNIRSPSQGVSWLRSWLAGCICTQLPPDTLFSREQFIDLVFQLPFTTFQLQLSPPFQAQRLAQVQAFDGALLVPLIL